MKRYCIPLLAFGGPLWLSMTTATPAQDANAAGPAASAPADTRLKLAETLLLARRYDEAVAEFGKVLAADPANRAARLGMGRAYFWSGRPEDARKVLEPLMQQQADAETLKLWGEIVGASGSAAAVEAMQRSVEANPDAAALTQSHARLLIALGCYNPAIQALRQLATRHPGNAEIAIDLALAYFTADRYPEAIDICRRYADDAGDAGRRARIILARSLLKSWHLAEANAVLQTIRRKDPDEPRACIGLLTTWVLDPSGCPVPMDTCAEALATDEARRRLQERPDVRDWFLVLVCELVSHGTTPERARLAERLSAALASDREAPATQLARQALDQYARGGPTAVSPDVEPLAQAIAQGAVERPALIEAGNLLLALFAGRQLVRICDVALARDPDDVAVALLRAEGLAITAVYKEAEPAYEKILAALPQCTKARRGLARTYSWHREFRKAEPLYEELIRQEPGDMAIRREAARSLGWDKQLRLSLRSYDDSVSALGASPPEATWRERVRGERDAKRADWWVRDRQAVDHYTRLLEQEPANQEARFDLAQVYARNRHWEEAADQYNRILNIDARHRRARDALYKNGLYHEPEYTVEWNWFKQQGYGDLLDITTCSLTETIKQEIARRTDLSFIATQMWHRFDRWGGRGIDEQDYRFRLDHRFNLQTWGHLSSGWAMFNDDNAEPERWIADAALTHKPVDWLAVTVGWEREPWRQNRATVKEAINENRLFVNLFSNINPWLDAWVEYGHSWLSDGAYQPPKPPGQRRPPRIYTPENDLDELKWGAAYRFSLFPKILQLEYRGFTWWYRDDVPTYYSPNPFTVNTWRLSWRHYLNNDQYVEQKKLYYEAGISGSVDSNGIGGIGYDAAVGWDICHHFGVQASWSSFWSNTYDSSALYLQLAGRI